MHRGSCTRQAASRPRPRSTPRPPGRASSSGAGSRAPVQRPRAARCSPGSRVQSSRGAVREMQLRFLRTLLRMVPTPPPPPPPCRFRHLPPRLKDPVNLSCRIREGPGSGTATARSAGRGAAGRAAVLAGRGVREGEGPRGAAAARPAPGGAGTGEAPREPPSERGQAGGHLQCGAGRLRRERARGGEEGGSSERAPGGGGAPAPSPASRRAGGAPGTGSAERSLQPADPRPGFPRLSGRASGSRPQAQHHGDCVRPSGAPWEETGRRPSTSFVPNCVKLLAAYRGVGGRLEIWFFKWLLPLEKMHFRKNIPVLKTSVSSSLQSFSSSELVLIIITVFF